MLTHSLTALTDWQALILKPTDAIIKKHLADAEKNFLAAKGPIKVFHGNGSDKFTQDQAGQKKKKKKTEKRMKNKNKRDSERGGKQKQQSERISEWDIGGEASL